MASTVITPVATALTSLLQTIAFNPPLWVPATATNTVAWAPPRIQHAPAAIIDIPTVRRTNLDEGGRELGSDDWFLSFPVSLYVDLKSAQRDQQRAVDLLEAVIAAIDANPSLGIPTIDDTKLVAGLPSQDLTEEARPLLLYECDVQVWARVPHT